MDPSEKIWEALVFLGDPATFGLIGLALTSIIFGAYQSRALYFHQARDAEGQPIQNSRQAPIIANNSSVIRKRTAILLPIFGSLLLVLLFYKLNQIFYLLLAILIACSVFSLSFIQWPFAAYFIRFIRLRFPRFPRTIMTFRFLGPIPMELFFVIPIPITLVVLYFIYNHWIITDIFALSISTFSMSILRVTNLRVAIIMLTFFFIYDMFWVFASGLIFHRSVMVVVATNLAKDYSYRLPMAVQLPTLFTDGGLNMLGLGDIILPGFFLCFLYRYDMSVQGHAWQGFFLNGCIGYTVGLSLALIMMISMAGLAQPALTYLVPCTLIPTIVLAYARKELRNLWDGSSGRLLPLRSDTFVDDEVETDGVSIRLESLSAQDQEVFDAPISEQNQDEENSLE